MIHSSTHLSIAHHNVSKTKKRHDDTYLCAPRRGVPFHPLVAFAVPLSALRLEHRGPLARHAFTCRRCGRGVRYVPDESKEYQPKRT